MAQSYTPDIAKHPTISDVGLTGFVQWMQTDPVMSKVYARAKADIDSLVRMKNAGFAGMGDLVDFMQPVQVDPMPFQTPDISTGGDPTSASWTDTLKSVISAAGQAVLTGQQIATANKVTNIQLQRAQSGQAPLNLSAYGVSTVPGLNLGLSSSTEKVALIGVAILAAAFVLPRLLRR